MSQSNPRPIVCWSPGQVSAFDPSSGRTYVGANAAEIAPSLGAGREVVAALSRRSAFVRTARVPNSSKEEVAKVLKITVGNHVPVPPGELAYDFHLTNDVDSEGRLAVIGAARIETLRAMQADLKSAGLHASQVLPVAFGSERIAQRAGLAQCAVAEASAEGLGIELVAGGEVRYSRVVPMPADPGEALEQVRRSFDVAGLAPGPIVAAGGLDLPGAQGVSESSLEALALEAHLVPLSLESPEVVASRLRSVENARSRFAVLLVATAVTVGTMVYLDFSAAAAKVNQAEAKHEASLRTLRSAKSAAEAKAAKAETLAGTLERAFDPAQPFSDVVTILAQKTPDGVWLNGISIERGKPLLVRGTAKQNEAVTGYLDALRLADGAEPDGGAFHARFRDVKLVVANNSTIETVPVVQFSVSAHPIGNLPLVPNEKKRTR